MVEQNPIAQVLAELNEKGNFPVSTLSSRDGLLVAASSSNGNDPNKQSAVVAKLAEAANLVRSQLSIGEPVELTFSTDNGRRLICRPFDLNGHGMILAILIPDRSQPYRRATSQAIARLRSVWQPPT
jgi:predicted regulator of Ras-like GTPase activity (Roadblock/LC7/MglB family)